MTGCVTRCTTFRTDNINNAWLDIRGHFGPVTQVNSSYHQTDIAEWTVWANNNGIDPVTNVIKFGNWLIWKCSYGTTNYGNLATRVRNHVGIDGVFCPYDTNADSDRTRVWLGLLDTDPLPTKEDHGTYYMKVTNYGGVWGWACTYEENHIFTFNI